MTVRDRIPGAASTIGGLPAVDQPRADPIAYAFAIGVEYAADGDPVQRGLNVGVLGGTDAITPSPSSVASAIMFSLPTEPVADPPTAADVPPDVAWEVAATDVPTVAVPMVPESLPFAPGTAFWLRLDVADQTGAVSRAVAWLPHGVPASADMDTVDTVVWVSVNGSDFVSLTAHAGDFNPDTPDAHDYTGIVGTLPEGARAVLVAPFGGGPFPVQGVDGGVPVPVTFTASGDPTVVSGAAGAPVPVSGPAGDPVAVQGVDGGTPVPVALPDPVVLTHEDHGVSQNGAGSTDEVVAEGASQIVFRIFSADAGTSLTVGPFTIENAGEELRFDAPAGCLLPEITATAGSGGGDILVSGWALRRP